MKKLFGTDGIRGVANSYPMTSTMAMNIGIAVAHYVKNNGYSSAIIGKDTRISGDMLESALTAGITSVGVDVLAVGVLPTPAVAFLLSSFNQININQDDAKQNSDKNNNTNQKEKSEIDSRIGKIGAGIVISASHNPWEDNGIKIFKKGGWKLLGEEEESIESMIFSIQQELQNSLSIDRETSTKKSKKISSTGRVYRVSDAKESYCQFLINTFRPITLKNGSFKPLKMVVDCSNGASTLVAPMLFGNSDISCSKTKIQDDGSIDIKSDGSTRVKYDGAIFFDATFIFNHPDGKNINEKCGSQHTETLSCKVLELGADIGLAFDGDADRLIAIDETGAIITGDRILAICASYAKSKGTLENNRVVSTVMSNIGLARTLESLGIEHLITGVGDREVLQKMIESGAVMGGEDSGHMIFSQYHTTGDGLLTALRLLEVMAESCKPLSELASIMKVYPQILMNVEVDASRPDFMAVASIADEIKAVESELGADGRVLVRYSGTQPLLRVMVEGPDHAKTKDCCERICSKIREYKL